MTYRGRATKLNDFDDTEFTCVELGSRILSTGSFDGTIKIWATGKGTPSPILELQNHNSPITCLNFDDKEEHLLVGFTDGSVTLWDLNKTKCIFQIPPQTRSTTHSVCHFPSYMSNLHPFVVALWRDDVVEILDLREMDKPIWNLVVACGGGPIPPLNRKKKKNLKFSPCGRWLVAYVNYWSHVTILNVITSQVQEIDLNEHVTCAEFHPTELILSVGTEPGQVYIYNFSTMMLEPTNPVKTDFGHLLGLAYADEGKFLFGIFPDSVRLLQTNTSDPPGNYATAEWKTVSHIRVLDSSMEGLLLVCSAEERELQIWITDLMKLTASPHSSPTASPPLEPNFEELPQEEQNLEKMLTESQESLSNLSLRLNYVRFVNSFLKKGKLKEAMDHLALVNNTALTNIILNERLLKVKDDEKLSSYYTLNDLKLILPHLKNLLSSDDKSHIEATLISFREIIRHFVSTTSTKSAMGGPFFDGLVGLKRQFATCQSYGGNIAVVAKELSKQIATM